MPGIGATIRPRAAVIVVCATLLGPLVLPGSSLASTTFGADLSRTPTDSIGCGGVCMFMNTALPTGAPVPLTSPVTGTVIRWRIKTFAFNSSGTITFRVIAPAGGGMFTGAGTGDTETTPLTTTTTTFSTQLPIQAGDYVAVDPSDSAQVGAYAAQTGASVGSFSPPLADGGAPASPSNNSNEELLVDADVAALPTSSVTPACSNTGKLQATVTSDPDPAVAPKAMHFRIDGGSEQVLATSDSGNQGSATIPVPAGSHTLEYWGEDTVGGLESSHHTASVLVDSIPPVVTITSDQGTTTYAQGEMASISVAATDSGSGLQTDPTGLGEALPTGVPGTFTVQRTATDKCGNSTTASFTYTVVGPPSAPTITRAKINSTLRRAKFMFTAASATGFQCALIKPSKRNKHPKPHFASCRSPKTYKKLTPGEYTFEVRGISSAGPGPPVKRHFKV